MEQGATEKTSNPVGEITTQNPFAKSMNGFTITSRGVSKFLRKTPSNDGKIANGQFPGPSDTKGSLIAGNLAKNIIESAEKLPIAIRTHTFLNERSKSTTENGKIYLTKNPLPSSKNILDFHGTYLFLQK